VLTHVHLHSLFFSLAAQQVPELFVLRLYDTYKTHPSAMLSPPRKALLCIHGAGTSGAIFRVQIAKLSAALRHEFDFVYVTAPHSTSPGPGVIPFFASMGPFYSWFRDMHESISHRLDAIYKPIQQKVGDWQLANPNSRIVGMLAFSEGALVAALCSGNSSGGWARCLGCPTSISLRSSAASIEKK
jgi:predicted esterase